jgi:Uma2 family endonuclease
MAMPDLARRYTVADVLAFPEDGNRYELIHGELLVTPAPRPRHQEVIVRFLVRLARYLEPLAAWRMVASPADISWDDATLVQLDLFVVPAAQASDAWSTYRDLVLAVEVISPSSRRTDRVAKRRLYQEFRVGTYWIVDHESGWWRSGVRRMPAPRS